MSAPPVHSTNPNHRHVCLAAGLLLIVLPRLPPVKAVVNSFATDFKDPQHESLQPVMTAVGCVSDPLLLAALFYILPFLLVTSTFRGDLPPQPSKVTPGEHPALDAFSGCLPGAWASVGACLFDCWSSLQTQPHGCNLMTAWQLPRCDWVALLCISQPGSYPTWAICHHFAWSCY